MGPDETVIPGPNGVDIANPARVEAERLRRENERLARELAKTKAALEVVGKAHALLELLSESADTNEVIDDAFAELAPLTSTERACELLGKSRRMWAVDE